MQDEKTFFSCNFNELNSLKVDEYQMNDNERKFNKVKKNSLQEFLFLLIISIKYQDKLTVFDRKKGDVAHNNKSSNIRQQNTSRHRVQFLKVLLKEMKIFIVV